MKIWHVEIINVMRNFTIMRSITQSFAEKTQSYAEIF